MQRSLINAVLASALALGMILPAFAQTYNGSKLHGKVTYVPVGTNVSAVLTSSIDSGVAKAGDTFNAKLYAPLYLGDELVLPANTILEGQIIAADKNGMAGKNGFTSMRLIAAITPDGTRYPMSATITAQQPGPTKVGQDEQGTLHGRSKKASVTTGVARTAAWTAGGTLLGIIFAPIVAGSVGAGAIAGVATGGAVGLGSNLWRKGKDVKIPSGTPIQFALDQPMSLSSGIAGAPNYVR